MRSPDVNEILPITMVKVFSACNFFFRASLKFSVPKRSKIYFQIEINFSNTGQDVVMYVHHVMTLGCIADTRQSLFSRLFLEWQRACYTL